MSSSSRDVELIIRAKNESTKVVDEFINSLADLTGAQSKLKTSSEGTNGVLARLSEDLTGLNKEFQNLRTFSKVAADLDKSTAALRSMEGALAKTTAELESLAAAQQSAAEATAKAKVAAEGAAAAYDAQKTKVAEVKKASKATSDEYKAQVAILTDLKAARKAANDALRDATRDETSVGKSVKSVSDQLVTQSTNLSLATKEWGDLNLAAARMSESLGGVVASQKEVAAAAAKVGERISETKAAARAENELSAAARKLRDEIDPLGKVQRELNAGLASATKLYQSGHISALELAQAQKVLADKANVAARALGQTPAGTKGAFLGLRPYELNSLTFQLNDVITQLGSGTPVMQVFAQQGGQVFQVFQRQLLPSLGRLLPLLSKFAPMIGIGVAALATLANVLKNVGDKAESLKIFTSQLVSSADGATYSAKALAETAHQLDRFGGSLADARGALSAFTKEGINPVLLEQFGRAAQNMADVTGGKVPEAAQKMATAFSGGYDAIKKLDNEFNFLTAAERDHIRAMFDSGEAQKARTLAFDIFYDKMQKGAEASRGPWAQAVKNFASAWDNLLAALENSTVVKGAVALIASLSKEIEHLTSLLPGAENAWAGNSGTTPEMVRLEERITKLRELRADAAAREARIAANGGKYALTGGKPNNLVPGAAADEAKSVAAIDKEIAAIEGQIADIRKKSADTLAQSTQAKAKVRDDAIDAVRREASALGNLTDAQKVLLAGQNAYRDAIRETGDEQIAQAKKALAINAELDRQRRAINYDTLASKIIGRESGGTANPNFARNPNSTATGSGQFLEKTWLDLFRKYFPDQAAAMGKDAILELRHDSETTKKMVAIYARENANVLQKAGVAVNEAALYLSHFLGPDGAIRMLKANPNASAVSLAGTAAANANKSVFYNRGANGRPDLKSPKTAGQLVQFAQRAVGASDDERALLADQAAILDRLNEASKTFNENLDARIKGWVDEADALKALADQEKLTIEQKYAAMRADEISKAIHTAEVEAAKAEIILTQQRRDEITKAVGALFDLKNAEAEHNAIIKQKRDAIADVIGLEQQRTVALQELNSQIEAGGRDQARIAELRQQIEDLTKQIVAAIPQAQAFASALGDERATAALDKVSLRLKTVTEQIPYAKEISNDLAQGLTNAWDAFSESVKSGKDVITSLGDAFRQFAAEFLMQIAKMIAQQTILNMLQTRTDGTNSIGNTIASALASALGGTPVGVHHTGGLAGFASTTRLASPTWFPRAPRFHSGGIPGLASNEVPAILQRNEEVLTRTDPRHVLNGGGGNKPVQVKIVNAIDAGEMISKGLDTKAGEQAILNLIQNNSSAIRSALA